METLRHLQISFSRNGSPEKVTRNVFYISSLSLLTAHSSHFNTSKAVDGKLVDVSLV